VLTDSGNGPIRGIWWLPSRPDRKVVGEFASVDSGPPTLTLDGSLELAARTDYPSYDYVLGEVGGQPTTLWAVEQVSMPMVSQHHQVLWARHALIGIHLTAAAGPFAFAAIEFDALGEWIGRSGLRHWTPPQEPTVGQVAQTVEYVLGEQPEVALDDGTSFKIAARPSLSAGGNEIRLRQHAQLEIRPTAIQTCDWFFDYVNGFRDLLTLISDHPVRVTRAFFVPSADAPAGTSPLISWVTRWGPARQASEEPRWTAMLFTLDAVQDHWPGMLRRWFERRQALSDALDLLLSLTYAPPTFWDTRLLLVAQSAEAFHRRNVRNKRWPDEQFDRWKREILTACPAEDRQRIDQLLRYSNEPTLRERLTELGNMSAGALPMLFDRFPNWIDTAINMRNAYTHRGQEAGPQFDPNEVYDMVAVTTFVIKACVLLELGLPADEIAMLIVNQLTYLRLRARPTGQGQNPGT